MYALKCQYVHCRSQGVFMHAHERRRTLWLAGCAVAFNLALATTALGADARPRAVAAPTREACLALKSLASSTVQVDAAEWVTATRLPAGPTGAMVDVPDHCLFRVVLDSRPSGIEDLRYGTGVELRLPAKWNGRLLFQG